MHAPSVLANLRRAACAGFLILPLVTRAAPVAPEVCAPDGAGLLKGENPIGSIHAHLCGFHFYSGDLNRSLQVEHYCSHLNADLIQCVIYDSPKPDARLIGVEYIISEALFVQLPAEEKSLWHSHRYEVMSGLLTAPDGSEAAERALLKEFVSTYGKTWNLWQVDRGDQVPLGLPKLMMGFTADGQVQPALVAKRDREQHLDAVKTKAQRADLPVRPVAAGADAWQHGPAFQISDALPPPAVRRP